MKEGAFIGEIKKMTSLITQASKLWLMSHIGFQQFGNKTPLNAQLPENNKKSDGMNPRSLRQHLPVLHYGTSIAALVRNTICTLCSVHTHHQVIQHLHPYQEHPVYLRQLHAVNCVVILLPAETFLFL